MPRKTPHSPQQKKALSYKTDRRNCYGQTDKASRKAIPKRKAQANRAARRAGGALWAEDPDRAEAMALAKRRARWKKAPDAPLGDLLPDRLNHRAALPLAEAEND